MGIYRNFSNDDLDQAESWAQEHIVDRHERAWHAQAIARVDWDYDRAIDDEEAHREATIAWLEALDPRRYGSF